MYSYFNPKLSLKCSNTISTLIYLYLVYLTVYCTLTTKESVPYEQDKTVPFSFGASSFVHVIKTAAQSVTRVKYIHMPDVYATIMHAASVVIIELLLKVLDEINTCAIFGI